jgi:hypothetical protein
MASVEGGRGLFVFGNGDYRARVSTIEQIVASVTTALNWKNEIAQTKEPISKDFVDNLLGEYENLMPHHFSPFAKKIKIERQGSELVLLNSETNNAPSRIILTGNNKFRVDELVNSQLGLVVDEHGVTYITLEQPDTTLVSKAMRKLKKYKGNE